MLAIAFRCFPFTRTAIENGVPASAFLSENVVMAVDLKRVHAIFLAAVEAADPVDQAAILDRECASDAELRQRVEALLKQYAERASLLEPLDADPSGVALSSSIRTIMFDPSADSQERSAPPEQGPVRAHDGLHEKEEELTLEFLQPSTSPGSCGRLGHHEVLEVVGRGAFGIVARAFDETLQRMVAIKVLSPQLASTSPARKRFLREARASASVRHENVVQIYAVEEQPLPYLVMEYIPGQTLQQKLDQTGPLEVPEILRIGGQIARGLAAAHERGLIHRDIKPGNILLENGTEPKVKITDFGLARAADDASVTQSGVIAGTPLYMAPEQAKGESLDPRVDLFSLGSVLYTMASGRPPFRAGTALAVLKRVAEDAPRPIHEVIPEVPQWLCAIIARLHAKDPARRYQSAAEVATLLEGHLAHLQQPSLAAGRATVKIPRLSKPHVRALLAAALLLPILGVAITYPRWRSVRPSAISPVLSDPGKNGGKAETPAVVPVEQSVPQPPRTYVLQGRSAVRDALIDFGEPDHCFGASARDNAVRHADQSNAFLVRYDLTKLDLPPNVRVAKAIASFYVWDPSSSGKTRVCSFPLNTEWDERSVTWREPAAGRSWKGGQRFALGADAGQAGAGVVVEPEQGNDTADPPIEYQLDVTDLVRAWLVGEVPNYGLAIAPVVDRSVDEGLSARFQVYGSEHRQGQYTPKLTVQAEP
jgi:hypothetical protein